MARLRRTLPGDFKELVAAGDAGKIKAALKKCEPDAYEDNSRRKSALMNPDLPEEIVRWLVTEYGADVNYTDRYGYTPLSEAAVRRPERIDLLLSLGAQIDFRKDEQSPTALMAAATSYSVAGVRRLAERGANLRLTGGDSGFNALEEALLRCQNIDIPAMAAIARLFIGAGVTITDAMRVLVVNIGRNFEFYRDSFASDYLSFCDEGLRELYQLFDVPPVPPIKKYDGSTPIAVRGKTWTEQYAGLWELLVPGSGKAAYVQGEAIRIIGRLSHEVLDNGGANWDDDFRAMRDALAVYLSGGRPAGENIIRAVRGISPQTGEETFNEIAEAVVGWILSNPQPVELKAVSYRR